MDVLQIPWIYVCTNNTKNFKYDKIPIANRLGLTPFRILVREKFTKPNTVVLLLIDILFQEDDVEGQICVMYTHIQGVPYAIM